MWKNPSLAFAKQETGGGFHDFFAERFNIELIAEDLRESVIKHKQELANLEIFRKTSAVVRKLRYSDGVDIIRQYELVGEFQHANDIMQPFLVAMPEYRKLYNENMAAGFENGFSKHDLFRGNAYMHSDDNYREMTSDMSTEYDENNIWHWSSNEDRQKHLNNYEKVDLQICRARVRLMDWEDEDPFSELNASC